VRRRSARHNECSGVTVPPVRDNEVAPRSLTCRGRAHHLSIGAEMSKRTCSIDGCEVPAIARGWCRKHYYRWKRTGDPTKLLRARVRKGHSVNNGYIILYRPKHPLANSKGYVSEHRMVAFDAGLLVDRSDHVHHRDGDRANNAIGNLEVVSLSEHARLHDHVGSWERAKTHCPAGHPYDEANTWTDARGSRHCRACWRDAYRRRRSAQ
jgi:hypothetical protein